jgi:hypothetical protein
LSCNPGAATSLDHQSLLTLTQSVAPPDYPRKGLVHFPGCGSMKEFGLETGIAEKKNEH